jgi:hypothetical protein
MVQAVIRETTTVVEAMAQAVIRETTTVVEAMVQAIVAYDFGSAAGCEARLASPQALHKKTGGYAPGWLER